MIIIPQNPSPSTKRAAGSFILTLLALASIALFFLTCAGIYYLTAGLYGLIVNMTAKQAMTTFGSAAFFGAIWFVIWREMTQDRLFDE